MGTKWFYVYTKGALVDGSSTPQTLFQFLAATNHPFIIDYVDFLPLGATGGSAPLLFEWVIHTDAGSGGTPGTIQKWFPQAAFASTIQTTVIYDPSTQPTVGVAGPRVAMHQQSPYRWTPPYEFRGDSGKRIGLRYHSSLTVAFQATVYGRE